MGTNGLSIRKMEPADMVECVDIVHDILQGTQCVSDVEYLIDPTVKADAEKRIAAICARRPISTYPAPQD